MAAQSQEQTDALSARLAASRAAVGTDLAALRRRLDVPARVKDSILSKPMAWFGGSLGVGLLASMLLKRPRPRPLARESKASRSLWKLALGGAFTLARPALQSWAMREFGKRFVIPGNDTVGKS
jgi:hypothetical protein